MKLRLSWVVTHGKAERTLSWILHYDSTVRGLLLETPSPCWVLVWNIDALGDMKATCFITLFCFPFEMLLGLEIEMDAFCTRHGIKLLDQPQKGSHPTGFVRGGSGTRMFGKVAMTFWTSCVCLHTGPQRREITSHLLHANIVYILWTPGGILS